MLFQLLALLNDGIAEDSDQDAGTEDVTDELELLAVVSVLLDFFNSWDLSMQSLEEVGISEADLIKLDLNLVEESLHALTFSWSSDEGVRLYSELVIGSEELDVDVLFGSAKIEILELESSSNIVELVDSGDFDVVVQLGKLLRVIDFLLFETEERDREENEDHQDNKDDHSGNHEFDRQSHVIEKDCRNQAEENHQGDEDAQE